MRKIFAPVVLISILTLTGCSGTAGGQASTSPASGSSAMAEDAAAPADLSGSWTQSNSQSETDFMTAAIADGVISVDWELGSEDVIAVYWVGTYQAPAEATDTFSWTSQRDVAATDTKLMASTDDTKDFTYDGDVISFPVSIQGQTATVELQKD